MASINNLALRDTLYYLLTIRNIVEKDLKHVSSNKSILDKFVPDEIVGIYSKNMHKALHFSDNISKIMYELGIISLVTTFEKVAFAKYRTCYGEIKSVVRDNTESPLDYFHSRERFVNDKIDRLQGIFNLIDGIIDNETMKILNEIKSHRNFIVHGKRDSDPPENEYDLEFIAKTLDRAISDIEKN